MMRRGWSLRLVVALLCVAWLADTVAHAHSGPPFPIVSNQVVGAYKISVWTDPDTTDDGSPAGQFWVVLERADGGTPIPGGTTVRVTIRPLDRPGPSLAGTGEPVSGALDRQFVALLMDHEGPFHVRAAVDGPLGRAEVESKVDATYDARPPFGLVLIYLFPFVALGALWAKVLLRRRKLGLRS